MLKDELSRFDIALPADRIALLDEYRRQLWQWNERLNLTRHTTLERFVTRDLVDSLRLADHLPQGQQVLDVGTGGGVPGVILAIVRPDLEVTVCDSVGKKARAVEAIVDALGIPVAAAHSRAEELLEVMHFDTLVARAVAPLAKLVGWLQPYFDAFDRLLVIKGRNWAAERGEARHRGVMGGVALRRVDTYATPGSDAESVILELRHKDAKDNTEAD